MRQLSCLQQAALRVAPRPAACCLCSPGFTCTPREPAWPHSPRPSRPARADGTDSDGPPGLASASSSSAGSPPPSLGSREGESDAESVLSELPDDGGPTPGMVPESDSGALPWPGCRLLMGWVQLDGLRRLGQGAEVGVRAPAAGCCILTGELRRSLSCAHSSAYHPAPATPPLSRLWRRRGAAWGARRRAGAARSAGGSGSAGGWPQ